MKHNEQLKLCCHGFHGILGMRLLNTSLLTVSEAKKPKKMLIISLICISSKQKNVGRREDLR